MHSCCRFVLVPILVLAGASAHAATIATVDEGPVAGQPSIAIGADGLPVIAYRTLTSKLRVAKCLSWDCSQAMRIELTGTYTTTQYFSLAITPNGYPAIAYQDSVERRLDVVRCVTADCTGGGHGFFTIDPGPNDVGGHVDWAFGPDGRAAFAYRDFAAQTLLLARCVTPACNNVTVETLHGGTGGVVSGEFASIAFGGRSDPAVASRWFNTTGGTSGVNYFDCSILPCEDARQTIHYDVPTPVGLGTDMAIGPDDLPVFSYIDHTNDTLRFARCANPDCSGHRDMRVVEDGSFAIGFDDSTSIGVRPDGWPVIAYQKSLSVVGARTGLYAAECNSATCNDATIVRIELSGPGLTTGIDADLAIDGDGGVAIAYFDQSALDIKLARCNPLSCEGPGDRIFHDGFDSGGGQ